MGKEEVQISMFSDDVMLHMESPEHAARKLLELITNSVEFWLQNPHPEKLAFLYTNNGLTERGTRIEIPFTVGSKESNIEEYI